MPAGIAYERSGDKIRPSVPRDAASQRMTWSRRLCETLHFIVPGQDDSAKWLFLIGSGRVEKVKPTFYE